MKAFLCQNHIENGNGHAIPKEIMPIQNMLAEGTFRCAFFFLSIIKRYKHVKFLSSQTEAVLTSIYSHPQNERGLPLDQPKH